MKRFFLCFIFAILLSYPTSAYPAVISEDVPPTITVQPKVEVEVPIMLSVTAIGTAPLKYQWQEKNYDSELWSDINGANAAEYTILYHPFPSTYRVVINNSYGSVTSNSVDVSTVFLPYDPPHTYPTDNSDNGGGCNNVMSSGGTFGFAMILLASLACSLRSEKKKK